MLKYDELFTLLRNKELAEGIWKIVGDGSVPPDYSAPEPPILHKPVTLETALTFSDFAQVRNHAETIEKENEAIKKMVAIGRVSDWMHEYAINTQYGTPWSRFVFDQIYENGSFTELCSAFDQQIGGPGPNKKKLIYKLFNMAGNTCSLKQVFIRAEDFPDIKKAVINKIAENLQQEN